MDPMRVAFLALGLALSLWGAQALSRTGATPDQGQEAKALFQEGLAHFQNEEYIEALSKFRMSYEIRPKPVVLYNIANCLKALKDYVGAIQTFEDYLSLKDPSITDEDRIDVARLIESMRPELANIRVLSSKPDIQVLLDGKNVGTTPMDSPILVSPGTHVLVAQPQGLPSRSREIAAPKGTTVDVDLDALFAETPAAAKPPEKGEVEVVGDLAGRTAWIRDKAIHHTPMTLALDPGKYDLGIADTDGKVKKVPFDLTAGGHAKVEVPALPKETARAVPMPEEKVSKPISGAGVATWVAGSAAFALLVPGLMLGRKAMNLYDDKYKKDPDDANRSQVQKYQWAANGCYIASGAMAFSTLVAGIVWATEDNEPEAAKPAPDTKKKASIDVKPALSGILIEGRF